MRVAETSAVCGDLVSAVNGTLRGPSCKIGILRSNFNLFLMDSPIAVFCDGSLLWFSTDYINNFAKFAVTEFCRKLNLNESELDVLMRLLVEEDANYAKCLTDSWAYSIGNGGEIPLRAGQEVMEKLAINITNFYDHSVCFSTHDPYGEATCAAAGDEAADDDTEFAAIAM